MKMSMRQRKMTTVFLVEAVTYSSEQANKVIQSKLKELP